MDLSPLFSLPPELIFQILDLMEPHEYAGFSCTCRHAVTLVNRKLDNPKDKEGLYSYLTFCSEDIALRDHLPPWKSRTARYVAKESSSRAMSEYLREYQESDCSGRRGGARLLCTLVSLLQMNIGAMLRFLAGAKFRPKR
jgi:hypothetical protein